MDKSINIKARTKTRDCLVVLGGKKWGQILVFYTLLRCLPLSVYVHVFIYKFNLNKYIKFLFI